MAHHLRMRPTPKTTERIWNWLREVRWFVPSLSVVLLVLAAFAVYVIWRQWALFRPATSTDAWTALGAGAAALSAICTIAIAAFAYRGLRSIRIARDEIVHRAETDAKLCAIHRLEEIAKEIVPLNTGVLEGLAAANLKVFLVPTLTVRFNPDPPELQGAARDWYNKVPREAYERIVPFLNRLEAWSVYFTTGVADPSIAFGPVAPLLRSWVGQYYAILLVLRSGSLKSSGMFPNLVQLYEQWSAQMDTQQLSRIHKDIEGQMDQAKARLNQSKLPNIVPKLEA